MPERETESKPEGPRVKVECDCEVAVTLPGWVRKDLRMLRWLHHRVVDLLARHARSAWMIQDIEDRLDALSGDLIDDAVNNLIAEASRECMKD
jgi:hypothetical protein